MNVDWFSKCFKLLKKMFKVKKKQVVD